MVYAACDVGIVLGSTMKTLVWNQESDGLRSYAAEGVYTIWKTTSGFGVVYRPNTITRNPVPTIEEAKAICEDIHDAKKPSTQ